MKLRQLHYFLAAVLMAPLALTAATGLVYRVGRNWFGMSDETGKFVRGLHEGAFLGEAAVPFYVLFVGLGLLALVGTGLTLLCGSPAVPVAFGRTRRWHRWTAAVLSLPLAVSAATGIAFRLAQAWFGFSKSEVKFLLDVHQGTYLGPTWRAYYVIVLGAGLLTLLVTGARLRGWWWKTKNRS